MYSAARCSFTSWRGENMRSFLINDIWLNLSIDIWITEYMDGMERGVSLHTVGYCCFITSRVLSHRTRVRTSLDTAWPKPLAFELALPISLEARVLGIPGGHS